MPHLLGAAVLLAAASCSPPSPDNAIGNNADTMDNNMAMKADALQNMAEQSSSAMAANMIEGISDTNISAASNTASLTQ
jgi:hypothetical protein